MGYPGHHKIVCSGCAVIISQCRCIEKDKETYYELCSSCAKKALTSLAPYDKLKEQNNKLVTALKNVINFEFGSFEQAKALLAEIELEDL